MTRVQTRTTLEAMAEKDSTTLLAGVVADGFPRGKCVSAPLASLEATLPPTSLKKLLAADGASLYVFSLDSALIVAVQQAGGDQYPVHVVAERTKLTSAIERGLCGIVLIDTDAVTDPLDAFIARLHGLAPRLVVLLAAPRAVAQQHIGLLSDRSIHRLLIKPAAVGITRLLLESAVSRYLQLCEPSPRSLEDDIEELERMPHERSRFWPASITGIAIVSLLMAAALGGTLLWLGLIGWRDGAAASVEVGAVSDEVGVVAAPVASVAVPPDDDGAMTAPDASGVAADPFAAELEAAAAALTAGRIAVPVGDSALDAYAGILAQDPGHVEARAGFEEIVETLYGRAESLLLSGELDAAGAGIDQIRRAQPGTGRLAFIEAQLDRARERQAAAALAAPPASAQSAPPRPTELESLLSIASARIERGQLIEPAGDSALAYLTRAQSLASDDPRLVAARMELADEAAAAARLALEAGRLERAVALADVAFSFGAEVRELAALEADLALEREQVADRARARLLALGVQRLQQGHLLEPEDDSAMTYLAELRGVAPRFPGLADAWRSFEQAAAARLRDAVLGRDWPTAEALLATLESRGADPAWLADLDTSVETSRRQAAFLADAAPASEVPLIDYVPPTYPAAAVRRNVEGWVDLEFVVGTDGRTHDLEVIAAAPADTFEQAALGAVAGYRYAPFELEGHVYERRLSLRIRFVLQ